MNLSVGSVLFGHVFQHHVWARRVSGRLGGQAQWRAGRTDEIVKAEESAAELAFGLHDHPDLGADALVDELEG